MGSRSVWKIMILKTWRLGRNPIVGTKGEGLSHQAVIFKQISSEDTLMESQASACLPYEVWVSLL